MGADYLRSGYTRLMRFVAGDPSKHCAARWYRCAPTAKPFPYVHSFGSANWDGARGFITPLGDDATVGRTYYNGRRLNRSRGTTFAGPAEFFRDGAPAIGEIPRAFDGTPVECLLPPFGLAGGGLSVPVVASKGGKKGGGKSIDVTPSFICPFCPDATPQHFSVALSGFAPPDAGFNGTWTLSNSSSGPCTWIGGPGGNVQLFFDGAFWDLFVLGAAANNQYEVADAFCSTPKALVVIDYSIGSGNLLVNAVPV